jgi:predicted CopG family antitoxin
MKKLTISIDDKVYEGLHSIIGRGNIGKFIEEVSRPYLSEEALLRDYAEMAADKDREEAAKEWADALIGDVAHDAR